MILGRTWGWAWWLWLADSTWHVSASTHTRKEETRVEMWGGSVCRGLSSVPRTTVTCCKLQHPWNYSNLCQGVSAVQELWASAASLPAPPHAHGPALVQAARSPSYKHTSYTLSPFCSCFLCLSPAVTAWAAGSVVFLQRRPTAE